MKRWDYTKLLVEFNGALLSKNIEDNNFEWVSLYFIFINLTDKYFSEDFIPQDIEIKLDINKKSRRINRPVKLTDQDGKVLCEEFLADILTTFRTHNGGVEIRP